MSAASQDAYFNPFDPANYRQYPQTPESAQAHADRIYSARRTFEASEPAPAPDDPRACISEGAWGAYDVVNELAYVDIVHPIPGWRIDHVRPDGTIAGYGPEAVQVARCIKQLAYCVPTLALDHGPDCTCGYRIVRDVWTLLQFADRHSWGAKSLTLESLGRHRETKATGCPAVLTRVLAEGVAAAGIETDHSKEVIRTSSTRLVEVFLPLVTPDGTPIADDLADKIRFKYPGVTVRRIPGSLYNFQGAEDIKPPYNWPASLFAVNNRGRLDYQPPES